MSNDLEQFYEIFFEESSELLADMEACLLRLDVNSPDLEDLTSLNIPLFLSVAFCIKYLLIKHLKASVSD